MTVYKEAAKHCPIVGLDGTDCGKPGTVLDADLTKKHLDAGGVQTVHICVAHARERYPHLFAKPPLALDGVTTVFGGQYRDLRSKPDTRHDRWR